MADIIIPWSGNHASIPSGWTRYTALDGKFPKSSGVESAGATGGATTHTHASPAHSHTLANHTHTGTLAESGQSADTSSDDTQKDTRQAHQHTFTSGNPSGGTTDTTGVTYGSMSNNPPNHELIFIKSSQKTIPADGLILWDEVVAPSNTSYKVTDGTASTIDLDEKYLRGAGTAQDSGTTGGSTENVHSIDHTHTVNNHTHSATSSGPSTGLTKHVASSGSANCVQQGHTHTVSLGNAIQQIDTFVGNQTPSEVVEPAYFMLMAYQNKGGSVQPIPKETIAMTDSATLPAGWVLCDGNNDTFDLDDVYVKITTTGGNISNTGGGNTHSHASQNHTHGTGATHLHSSSVSAHANAEVTEGNGSAVTRNGDTHATNNSSSDASAYAQGSTTANSSSNEPEYVILKFIQKKTSAGGGALFFLQLLSLVGFIVGSFSAFSGQVDALLIEIARGLDNSLRLSNNFRYADHS